MAKAPLVKKASGESEPFKVSKLEESLKRAGASNETIAAVSKEIEDWIHEGVTTKKIYTKAFALLRKRKRSMAARYSLKKALMDLGPTGYPFEHFIGQLFKAQGFEIEVGQIIQGQCVNHEVDVVAKSKNRHFYVECKFYNSQGKYANVQVPLYIQSRVNDIIKKHEGLPQYKSVTFLGMIVTNTRFTSDAMQFGKCSGLHLLSWDYPKGYSLKETIERERIFPITALTQLNKKEKQFLMDKGIVFCRQILSDPNIMNELGIKRVKQKNIIEEIEDLCGE